MQKQSNFSSRYIGLALGVLGLAALYLSNLYSYLLFHSIIEIFSVVVACSIGIIVWNSRRFADNNYFLLIGIASLFVGGIDLLHTLAYKGMGVFQGYDANLATQLWIAGRYVQSLSLFVAPLFFGRKLKLNLVFLAYSIAVALLLLSIFYWDIFPACFVEGAGLTTFKKVSEYIISLILLGSLLLLLNNRKEFDREILNLLALSIVLNIGAELSFTFYVSVYGISNLIGHFFRLISFYLIYKALIETSLTKPYSLLFRNQKLREEALRTSEENFRNLVENLPVGVSVFTYDGQVLSRNKSAVKSFGFETEEESLKAPLMDTYFDTTDKEQFEELLSKGQVKDFEVKRKRKDGKMFWLSMTAIPLPQDPQNKLIVVSQDITERKEVTERLAGQARFLKDANTHLNALNRDLEAFSYSVSHDLRAPLRSIDGFSQILIQDYGDKFTGESKDYLQRVRAASQHMGVLIDDLLRLSRVTRSEMHSETVNLSNMAKSIADELQGTQPGRQVEFVIAPDLTASGDARLLRIMLENLLGNAWKYTGRQLNARIEFGLTQDEGKPAFFISDNGAGFDTTYVDKIFQPFQRLHSQAEFPGSGIGLAIVSRIINRHGGNIRAIGAVNKGATFYFNL